MVAEPAHLVAGVAVVERVATEARLNTQALARVDALHVLFSVSHGEDRKEKS